MEVNNTQVNSVMADKQEPKSMIMLKAGLEELNGQIVEEDIEVIAKKSKCSTRTVKRYLREKIVSKYRVGKKILTKGRIAVIERENEIKKLVA